MLGGHPQDEQAHSISSEVLQASMEKHGAGKPPDFTAKYQVLSESSSLHYRSLTLEKALGYRDKEDHGVHGD
jgi:hypothetical protein